MALLRKAILNLHHYPPNSSAPSHTASPHKHALRSPHFPKLEKCSTFPDD